MHVISCFPVFPRRRRNEFGPVTDRKAFRLCISDANQNRLFDESLNGQSRSSFLIGMTEKRQTSNATTYDDDDAAVATASDAAMSVKPIASGAIGCDADLGGDGDNTVLYRDDNTVVKSVGNCVDNCVADNHGDQ